tara:strand:+ start:1639 stop:2166 length:528 start_codon:yes stop_codon:yes gene_type:complete
MEQIRRYKKEIGIAVIVIIILSIISSFFSGSKKDTESVEPQAASTSDEPQVASMSGNQVASMSGNQVASMSREDMENTVIEAKFGGSATMDPSTLAQVQQMASKLAFNNLDINEDNKISTDEIPDGDLKDELFGYDLDEDGVIVLEEYEEFFKNRQSKSGLGTVTRSDNLSVSSE